MKKFIKGRWFPLTVAAVAVLVIAFILFFFGFRITYAPKLEINWEAVSAVAAWVGVISSFIAIWFAIQVPKKIADRQDKIALFEKRYQCFQLLEECFVLYKNSLEKNAKDKIIRECYHILEIETPNDLNKNTFQRKARQFEYTLHQIPFLFEGIDENDLQEVYSALIAYLSSLVFKKDFEKEKQDYISAIDKLGKHIDTIWDSITISNIK